MRVLTTFVATAGQSNIFQVLDAPPLEQSYFISRTVLYPAAFGLGSGASQAGTKGQDIGLFLYEGKPAGQFPQNAIGYFPFSMAGLLDFTIAAPDVADYSPPMECVDALWGRYENLDPFVSPSYSLRIEYDLAAGTI